MSDQIHREWFRPVSLGKRKSCPSCKQKILPNESIWSWGEYVRARWCTVRYFCKSCWPEIQLDLIVHREDCGCNFELVGYQGENLPSWLELPSPPDDKCRTYEVPPPPTQTPIPPQILREGPCQKCGQFHSNMIDCEYLPERGYG